MLQMEMGGSERLVHSLSLNLDRKLFNPSIAWFFGDGILDEFKKLEIPLYHVPKIKRFDFLTMRKLGRIINDNDIQVVNAHHFMSMVYSFYGCKIANKKKLIYTEHSDWELEKISWKWRKTGSYLLKISDGIVGVNGKVTNMLKSTFNLDPSKAFTIQNGVDIKKYKKLQKNNTLKMKLGIAENELVIATVANLKKIKNHIFLLHAFKEVLKEFKNVKLVLVGQGFKNDKDNTEKDIRGFINKNGLGKNILLLGYRSDIPAILGVTDIFCLTSFKEGLPISLIEAMATGIPVIGTDVDGIKDVINPNINGFLVKIGDMEKMKSALYTLLNDESLRKKFGRESKVLATRNYSLRRCISQYQELFMPVLER